MNTEEFEGKPVIAILNTWTDLIPCHAHFRQRAEEIKRGVWQAGGFPVEVPVLGLSETFMKPTAMMYRNLLAMETEEVLRGYPIDGAVLMAGCDKTIPALIMGAAMVDVPVIFMPRGPDDARNLAWGDVGFGNRCLALLGGTRGWKLELRCVERLRRSYHARTGALHDDGDGIDDDISG